MSLAPLGFCADVLALDVFDGDGLVAVPHLCAQIVILARGVLDDLLAEVDVAVVLDECAERKEHRKDLPPTTRLPPPRAAVDQTDCLLKVPASHLEVKIARRWHLVLQHDDDAKEALHKRLLCFQTTRTVQFLHGRKNGVLVVPGRGVQGVHRIHPEAGGVTLLAAQQ